MSDDTVKIADKFGAITVEQEWLGYRNQKNVALEKTTQPWVLSLDSDEELSSELEQSIRTFIKADDPAYSGAFFPRKAWFMGRWITHGTWYPDHCLRLLRRGSGRWIGGTIHEKLEVDGAEKKLQDDLLHYPYRDMKDQLNKMAGYSDLYLKQQLKENRKWTATGTFIRSVWYFIRAYIFKLGILDGYPGLYIAWGGAFSTFLKHSRLYEHQHHSQFPENDG